MANNMNKFLQYRSENKVMTYDGYEFDVITRDGKEYLRVTYQYYHEDLDQISTSWDIPTCGVDIDALMNDGTFIDIVCDLGMVEMISYWKTCCPKKVEVKCKKYSKEAILWWKELFFYGLGEFFYTNGIETTIEDFIEIDCENAVYDELLKKPLVDAKGCMVPVGGGKDSAVSIELMRKAGENIYPVIINPRKATMDTVKVAGLEDKTLLVYRKLDGAMADFNKAGFLNGHIPFSAVVAFGTTLTAYLNNIKYIALSNEDSANESTVKGTMVNHQYSKSFKFEKDFHEYEEKYIGSGTYYFSLLRPLSEFQIAGYFAKCTQYHDYFRSCNVGSKTDIWCGHCAKCLFVYLIMGPFLSQKELEKIFGKNMVEDETMKEDFDKLIGQVDEKPFECVGSRDEVNTAICIAISNIEKKGEKMPTLFEYYKTTSAYKEYANKKNVYFDKYNEENLLPEKFANIVKEQVVNGL